MRENPTPKGRRVRAIPALSLFEVGLYCVDRVFLLPIAISEAACEFPEGLLNLLIAAGAVQQRRIGLTEILDH